MAPMVKSAPSHGRPNLGFVFSHLAHAVSFSGGLGLSPVWPGTVGAAGAVPFALLLLGLPGPVLAALGAASFALGVWAAGVTERALGEEDPSEVVFDETWAMALTFLAIPATPLAWIAGFLAFRFFDIVKPQPIRMIQDRVPGGLGVMADDLAAGLAAIVLVDVGAMLVGWA